VNVEQKKGLEALMSLWVLYFCRKSNDIMQSKTPSVERKISVIPNLEVGEMILESENWNVGPSGGVSVV
jgi:hypothetical protein